MIKWEEKSLSRKISIFSLLRILLVLTIFNLIVYFGTTQIFLARERYDVEQGAEVVRDFLSQESALTVDNLLELLDEYNATRSLVEEDGTQYILDKSGGIDDLTSDNQDVAIFNKDKQLVLTTDKSVANFKTGTVGKIKIYRAPAFTGYYSTAKVYSKNTKEVIGYVTLFQHFSSYYRMRYCLVAILLITELAEMGLISHVLFSSTKRFLRPLEEFQGVVSNIAETPGDLTVRSAIHSGDEIEEISANFDKMLDQIEGYTKRQARFVSDVSHELRTPIAVIKGHLGLLKRWGKEDQHILEESLDAAYHETDRMSIMVNEMLDMVRVQGSFGLHKGEKTDLKKSIEFVLGNFRILHPDFNFQFSTSVEECVFAEIYKNHFEQAILILIDNGVKYSSGSKIIHVTLDVQGDDAIIKVQDEGEGISQEDLKYIFERFYRTDKSRNCVSTQGGLGIGLAILKQIVNAYEINVSVNSVVDEGTEFTLVIPIIKAKQDKTD